MLILWSPEVAPPLPQTRFWTPPGSQNAYEKRWKSRLAPKCSPGAPFSGKVCLQPRNMPQSLRKGLPNGASGVTFRSFFRNASRKARSAFERRLPSPNTREAPPGGLGFVKNSLRNRATKTLSEKSSSESHPMAPLGRLWAKSCAKVSQSASRGHPKRHPKTIKKTPLRTTGARTLAFSPPGRFRGTPPLENPRILMKKVAKTRGRAGVHREDSEPPRAYTERLKTKKCGGTWRSPPGYICIPTNILYL